MAKILVVNDTEAVLHVLQEILTAEGHDIFTASSGKQALEQFRTHNPDLLITDVNMPLMDGFELARKIRKVALHTPVIFTSAVYGDVASKAGPMEAGNNDYLPGPTDFDELKYKVMVMLERKKTEMRLDEMEDLLREAAITDDLTGLFNKRGFFTVAEQQRKFAVRNKRKLALLYLDLNNMKDINDRFGHDAGDLALTDTAGILKKAFRESDISARIGSDEFTVLLTDHAGPDNEHVINNHIDDLLTELNRQSGRPYELSLSLGMAHFDPGIPCSIAELMTRADAAMYESKKQYKNNRSLWAGGVEKRGHKRHAVAGKYWTEIPGSGRLEIKNISMNGLCLRTSRQLQANSIHDISILPSGNCGITPKCRAIWSLPIKEEGGSAKTFHETGLRFIELDEEVKYLVEEFVTGLSR